MAKIKRDWVEPAHPVLVQRFDDFIHIYRFIREALQLEVDATFDKVSQQIGFVVSTTLPVALQIAGEGKLERIEFVGKNFQGTLFEREFAPLFKKLSGKQIGKIAAGSYNLYLLWHEALKLKLKADWIEPAHYRDFQVGAIQPAVAQEISAQLNPGIREPAHWFDAGFALAKEEEILIAAIDEVYTDLKLAERVAVARRDTIRQIPGVREPAHFRAIIEELINVQVGRKLGPGVREPAHFRRIEELLDREDATRLIAEMTNVLQKYGL